MIQFLKPLKIQKKRIPYIFHRPINKNVTEALFINEELSRAIGRSKNNSLDPDNISNMMLKAIPTTADPYIPALFNQI